MNHLRRSVVEFVVHGAVAAFHPLLFAAAGALAVDILGEPKLLGRVADWYFYLVAPTVVSWFLGRKAVRWSQTAGGCWIWVVPIVLHAYSLFSRPPDRWLSHILYWMNPAPIDIVLLEIPSLSVVVYCGSFSIARRGLGRLGNDEAITKSKLA